MAKSFASPQAEARFFKAYDDVLARWPVGVESIDLVTQFGSTHVQAYGPDDAPSVVLLSGGGATSTVWFNNVEALGRDNRVYAVDLLGDAGRSVPGGRPIVDVVDLRAWLDGVLDRLGLLAATFVGHSYGGQVPTIIVLAEHSRAHDIAKVARNARQLMPRALIQTVPDVSHHGLPMRSAEFVNNAVLGALR